MLVEPLRLRTPLAAFNGGLVVDPEMDVVEEKVVPDDLVAPVIALLESFGLSVWVYQGADWLVRDLDGPHVAREAHTVQFSPTLVESFDGVDERHRQDRRRERRPRHASPRPPSPHASSSATTSPRRARSRTTST